jgi:transcriptional regulator with XRE-family HTH domain
METLGQRIRRLRERRNMKPAELAQHAGRSVRWLQDLEQDRTSLSRRTAEPLASALQVDVGVVLGVLPLPPTLGGPAMGLAYEVDGAHLVDLEDVADTVEWLSEATGLSFSEIRGRVSAIANQRATAPGAGLRAVGRQRLAAELAAYYGEDRLEELELRPYSVSLAGERLDLSVVTRPEWRSCAVPLANPAAPDLVRERCLLAAIPPPSPGVEFPEVLDAALARLAKVVVAGGPVIVNKPLFRLLDIEIGTGQIEARFAIDWFAHYALTYDLLESELVGALRRHPWAGRQALPLRNCLLPDAPTVAATAKRLCAGGIGCLLAIARPGTRSHPPDFLIVVQRRSMRVLNVQGSLGVMPKAFHQHLVDAGDEATVGTTVSRELEEELFARADVDEATGRRGVGLSPYHRLRQTPPMRWLIDHAALQLEATAFGLNLMTGNYDFACLALVHDEGFWAAHAGACLPNWEATDIQTYSTAEPDRLHELIADPRWNNESLFGLLEGLRRLAQLHPERVTLPPIEVLQ